MEFVNTLVNFFIQSAYADSSVAPSAATTAQQPGFNGFPLIVMVGIFILYMYFIVLRPQNKRAKEQRALLGNLTKGDEVVTAGGILGKIVKVNDNYAVIALADNVEITIQKSSIVNALPKGTLKSI